MTKHRVYIITQNMSNNFYKIKLNKQKNNKEKLFINNVLEIQLEFILFRAIKKAKVMKQKIKLDIQRKIANYYSIGIKLIINILYNI